MIRFSIAAFVIVLCSCTKYTPQLQTVPNSKARIEFSSINRSINTGFNTIHDIWHITSSQVDTSFGNDSSKTVVLLDSCSLRINNYTLNSNYPQPDTIYDSVINIGANKTYSLITVQKHPKNGAYKLCPMLIEEKKIFSQAAAGFAKIRFIIGVPTVGSAQYNKDYSEMTTMVVLTSNQYQIDLAAQGRYSLDNLFNQSVFNFTLIPAGNYVQSAVMPSMPGLNYTFQSGKKYTVLVTRMARTQYPENDNLKVIEHSF